MIDFNSLKVDRSSISVHERPDTQIRMRRLQTLLTLSRSIYHSRTNIPPGFRPEMYQLAPLDMLNRPWLGGIITKENDDGTLGPKYVRKGILLADEGGMGKTLSAAIVALEELYKNPKQSVVVICPKLLKNEWEEIFRYTPFKVNRISGEKLASGNLNHGINILSKHAMLGHLSLLQQHQGKISLLILDEAHEGFISQPEDIGENMKLLAPLTESIRRLTSRADRLVLATATPMRNSNEDLFRLCSLIQENIFSKFPDYDESWYEDLSRIWLPALEDIRNGINLDEVVAIIQTNGQRFLPLEHEEMDTVIQFLEENINQLPEEELHTLSADLHPLGKFLSVTLRDDLGGERCNEIFRRMTSETFIFATPELDDIENRIDDFLSDNAPRNWKTDFISCPMNLINTRYKLAVYLTERNMLSEWEDELQLAWSQDQRLLKLIQIVQTQIDNALSTPQGVVLFSSRVGTNEEIKKKLEETFGASVKVFLFHPPPDENSYDKRKDYLRQARKISIQGEVLPILLSGESGSVGQNMEWANVMVHWDAIKSPAMIAQKSWRLDRRIASWEHTTRDFTSFHFIKQGSEKIHIHDVNSMYKRQRSLLSDRRFIFDQEVQNLIPSENGQTILHEYSPTARGKTLTYPEAIWLYRFIRGETDNATCHAAEIMAWSAVIELTDFDFWDGKNAIDMYPMNSLHPLHRLDDESGTEKEKLHTLISITNDQNEQKSLTKFAGGNTLVKPIVIQSSHAVLDNKRPYLLPTPTGELISFFQERITGYTIGTDYYPFSVASIDLDHYDKEFKLLAHLGMLSLNFTPIGKAIRKVRGERTHCGLIQITEEGMIRYLTYEDLDDELFIELFRLVAILSDQNIYPEEFFPVGVDIEEDVNTILVDCDYRDYYVPPGFGEANDLMWGMSTDEFGELLRWRGAEGEMPMPRAESIHIIPLIHVHQSEEERQSSLCPVCQSEYATQCCENWIRADEFGDGKYESGWL